MKNQIYPCLWFDGNAKDAATFYCSIFGNSKITTDTPMVVNFQLDGQKFMGLNGGPQFKPNPSISFFVVCETEAETDAAWEKLGEGGSVLMPLQKYDWSEKYGWVQDRFGISWQLSLGKLSDVGQKFSASLLFTGNQHVKAEEAIRFYVSLFKNAELNGILKYGPGEDEAEGTVKHAMFRLNNYVMMAMDSSGPHHFNFNEGISLVVECETQEEIDHFWNSFTRKGEESMCGWLKDEYGVSWQIIPSVIGELMSDPQKGGRVMQAILKMRKIEIDKLVNA